MKEYRPEIVEPKWQKIWEEKKLFEAVDFSEKPKFYGLIEFPYPSGAGLHVGHIRAFTSMEVIARKRRLQGYNVLFPIGWDAFGLPTENYAMKTNKHPRVVTDDNIKTFISQLKRVGYSFDWSRTVDTTDPDYYKWTQWIFVQLFKRGLAYRSNTYVNFCENCKVVLSNEESQGGTCDRCGSPVIQKQKDVWFLKIRDYADKLLSGLDGLDFLPRVKTEQENWIGRSYGAEIDFPLTEKGSLRVFTTRADTIFGVTFMCIAPEHPLIEENRSAIRNMKEVEAYQESARRKNEFERVQLQKDKTGVMLDGVRAINPLTGKEVPIFVADYVMMGYGTGAIMAVPAHDTRDYDFAKKYSLPIVQVIDGDVDLEKQAYTDISNGTMINSGFLNGLSVKDAIAAMIDYLEKNKIGERKVNYNMKDWAFNRQRYWGEPIPIVYCDDCGMVPVPEEELPLRLPDLENYKPTDTGESPLSQVKDWVNCVCPKCGKKARRETDTMPQWAGSSWYYLRYIDPKNGNTLADKKKLEYWGPVDWYNGGMEHVTRHLIYSRFWNRFLFDIGCVPFPEPYKKRTAQGLLLGSDGNKMSKSLGNVVNPNDCIEKYGSDVLRTYIMFIGDYERPAPWSDNSIVGCKRFIERIWRLPEILKEEEGYSKKHESSVHKLIKKVSEDYEATGFNTAIAAMMGFVNEIYQDNYITRGELKTLLTLLYPVAPHVCEEINEAIGNERLIAESDWPIYDEKHLVASEVEIPVQVLGKLKGRVTVARDASQEEVVAAVMNSEAAGALAGKTVVKTIYVPGKIVNFIVK